MLRAGPVPGAPPPSFPFSEIPMIFSRIGRRRGLAAAAVLLLAGACAHAAESYPARPIRLIIPFSTGGMLDSVSRLFTTRLEAELGQPVVVDYKPRAGSNIGVAAAARAAPDGYTMVLVGMPFVTNPALYERMPYTQDELKPVGITAAVPLMLVTGPNSPFRTMQELRRQFSSNPRGLSYASAGLGTLGNLGMYLWGTLEHLEPVHVLYKGGGAAMTDVMGGQVDLFLDTPINSGQMVKAGRLRPLLVTSSARLAEFPEVPTAAELGLPKMTFNAWLAFLVPAATPATVTDRLAAAIDRIQRSEDFRQQMAAVGTQPMPMTQHQAADYIRSETARWGAIVRQSGARAE